MEWMTPQVRELIRVALQEDLGLGDVTSRAIVPSSARAWGTIRAKSPLVLAGLEIAGSVFEVLDPGGAFQEQGREGEAVVAGAPIAEISGDAQALLGGERLALNFLQRLSGIATLTAEYVKRVQGTKAQILDTRKTTPGWRTLEKYAVYVGGGRNHRYSLGHAILIKDNHIALAGGIGEAVARARQACPLLMGIEVEVQTLDQVREALEARVDVIMLDNMSWEQMRKATALIGDKARVEASGSVSLEEVEAIAKTGVDFISVGKLTHSAPAADIAMKVISIQ
ncbi:MAG: carboxylating nicotinate-nucleotide diphosphorylase [Candidatus Binatia bacterium]